MRLKKFVCNRCGAPKVNTYVNPYIVCDFCGTLTDIDYAMGYEADNKSQEETQKYVEDIRNFETQSSIFLYKKDRENYYTTQYEYWDCFYSHYSKLLPSTVNTKEKYELYVSAGAEIATELNFNEKLAHLNKIYNKFYNNLILDYAQKNKWDGFNEMIDAYFDHLRKDCPIFLLFECLSSLL